MATKQERKTAREKKLDKHEEDLQGREKWLENRTTQYEEEAKRRREREVVENRAADDKKKELDEREAKVAQRERDAEAGKALRVVGRALVEGAFLDEDGDGRRQWPTSLAQMLFGPSPYGRGW